MRNSINRSVITIAEGQSALNAAQLMAESETGCLLVVDPQGKLSGIITGRDLVMKVLAKDRAAGSVQIKEVMTRSPTTAEDSDLEPRSLARILGRARVRRLPIVDAAGKPVGIITLEDLLVYAADIGHSIGAAVSSYLTVARLKTASMHNRE